MKIDLRDRRILITRAEDDACAWLETLEAHGAETYVIPCVSVETLDDLGTRTRLARALSRATWIAFTSRRAIDAVTSHSSEEIPAQIKVAAVGPGTARHAEDRIGRVDLIPYAKGDGSHASALAEALRERIELEKQRARVVYAAGELASDDFERELAECETIDVARVDVYRTLPAPPTKKRVDLAALSVDTVVIASPSAVLGLLNVAEVPASVRVITIGPTTTAAARRAGLAVSRESRTPAIDGIVASIDALSREGDDG